MKNKLTKNLTFDAFIFAIILLLTLVKPLGYPKFGPIQATTIHIPVIFAIAYYKKYSKALMFGLFFGISSLTSHILAPGVFSPFFINPMVSVLPRVAMALCTCWLFKKLPNTIAAFTGAYLNTIFVLLSLTLLYKPAIEKIIPKFWTFIQIVILTNALAEAILASLITTAVIRALNKRYQS